MTDGAEDPRAGRDVMISADRAKAFVDAVVAIAMTLLILPLMEAVTSDAGKGSLDAATWLGDHGGQLRTFVLSFVLVAMFWINHHRLYAFVERVSIALLWINVAWLLTIVWLPVSTALVNRSDDADPAAAISYLSAMIMTSVLLLAMRVYLRAHPHMHDAPESALRGGIAIDLALILLFGIALTLILVSPDVIGYWAMLIMFLTGPVQALFSRVLGAKRVDAAR